MSYIGRQNLVGAYRQLDDISSGFDGSDTTHTMQVNSQNVTVGDVNQIILSLGGVIQKPGTDFTVSGSVLTFTTAPASGTSFFAVLLGSDNGGTTTPTDLSVSTGKIAADAVTSAKIADDAVTGDHVASSGAFTIGASGTASTIAGITFHRNGDDDGTSIYTADVSGTDNLARSNTGFGMTALDAITTGDNNAVFGYAAATALDSGVENTAIGRGAMQSATSASYNTCVGNNAGNALSSGDLYNVLVGHGAGLSITSGNRNIAIGVSAMDGFDTETHNLGIGVAALGGSIAGGEYNVAIGNYALDALTSADYNVAVGYNCMTNLTTGGYNHAIGRFAGDAVTDETFSVYIGYNAGDDYTGSQSIMIGSYTRHASSGNDEANAICIGHSVNTGRGNQIHLGNTSMTAIKGQVSFSTYSDERIKRDIVDGDLGLEFIEKLKPRKFKRKEPKEYADLFGEANKAPIKDEEKELVFDGLIAQEVEQTCKELGVTFSGHEISQNTGNKQSIQYETLVVPLIKAVQELSAKVKELESK